MKYIICAILVVFLSTASFGADGVKMRYKDGTKNWILSYKLDTEITSSGNSTEFSASGREKITIDYISEDRIIFKAKGERFDLESEHDLDPNELRMLAPGQEFIGEINSLGKLVKTIKKPSDGFEYAFVHMYPEKKMKIGGTFKEKSTMDIPRIGEVNIDNRFKLLSVKNGKAKYNSKMKMVRRENEFYADSNGKMIFDIVNGVILRGRMKTSLRIKLNNASIDQSIYFNWDMRQDVVVEDDDDFDLE